MLLVSPADQHTHTHTSSRAHMTIRHDAAVQEHRLRRASSRCCCSCLGCCGSRERENTSPTLHQRPAFHVSHRRPTAALEAPRTRADYSHTRSRSCDPRARTTPTISTHLPRTSSIAGRVWVAMQPVAAATPPPPAARGAPSVKTSSRGFKLR
jgi:hypothetical protein